MSNTKDLKFLLSEQLNEIINAERLLLEVIPIVTEKASGHQLVKAMKDLELLVKRQYWRIKNTLEPMNLNLIEEENEELFELMEQFKSLSEYSVEPEITDQSIVTGIAGLKNFQMACYGAAGVYAKTLGYDSLADELQEVLDEKKSFRNNILELSTIVEHD